MPGASAPVAVVFAALAPDALAIVVALAVAGVPALAASAATVLCVLLLSAVLVAYAVVPVAFAAVVPLVALAPTFVFPVSGGRGPARALAIRVSLLFPCSAPKERAEVAVVQRETFGCAPLFRASSYRWDFLV